jgi:hypothetical protein
MEPPSSAGDSVFSRIGLRCWQIARVASGHLKAHPYQSYQREAGTWSRAYGNLRAGMLHGKARYGGPQRGRGILAAELQAVARALDDARALTWFADLSDTFGRLQTQIRRLLAEIESVERREEAPAVVEAGNKLAGNWPYLAF